MRLSTPFILYSEMFKLGLQTSQLLMSSGEVIYRRSKMIRKAMKGELPWTDPEFIELWQEKVFANMESCNSLGKSLLRKSFSPNTNNSIDVIKTIAASALPYHKKARANANRLRSKK